MLFGYLRLRPRRGPFIHRVRVVAPRIGLHILLTRRVQPLLRSRDCLRIASGLCRFQIALGTIGCGVVPIIGDKAEPLAAIYPREAGADFAAALAGSDFSLQPVSGELVQTGKLRVFQVSETAEELYRSVNEPEDFENGSFPKRASRKIGDSEAAGS